MGAEKGLTSLADILRRVREKNPQLGKSLSEAEAVSRWESAVGPMIAKHARAVKVMRSQLWIEVDHPVWKTELHHRRTQILAKLNAGKSPSRGKDETLIEDLFFIDSRGGM